MELQRNQKIQELEDSLPDQNSLIDPQEDLDYKEHGTSDPNHFSKRIFAERLPVQATSNDAAEVVRFLKNKPSGISFTEILNSEPRRVFESRKIEAYEYWGIVENVEERLRLTSLGNRLAKIVTLESQIFEEIIFGIHPYMEILRWINQQNLSLVTYGDINYFYTEFLTDNVSEGISEAEVISFFTLCHSAELGVATIGKRGQPTRLRVDVKRLEEFLSESKEAKEPISFNKGLNPLKNHQTEDNYRNHSKIRRIYVSAHPKTEIARNLENVLELADFESINFSSFAKDEFLQREMLQKMQLCQAGIVVINEEDYPSEAGYKSEINRDRLTEITAALGLFNWKAVIIWNASSPPPEFLQNSELYLLVNASEDLKTVYKAVKLLKDMNINQ